MRALALIGVLMCAAGATAGAQEPLTAQGPPGVTVLKYGWSKERIGWEKDPFGATLESFDDARQRVTRERRGTSALQERAAGAERAAKSRPPRPPRYAFSYKLTLHNAGPRAIKEIDWDYVFLDAATGEELGRLYFMSAEKIGPGKRKEFSVFVPTPPTMKISVYALGKRERDGLSERIVLARVVYEDGSVWRPQP